jgi:CubicO group peptidase (beta-lactamase class C family)
MTTGVNDAVPDLDCTLPSCLTYLADAGTRWSYHNALYTLIHRVVDSAAGPQSWQQFHNTRIAQKTGINGIWFSTNGYNNVFFSKPRSAARFGLLMLSRGMWGTDTVLGDTAYIGAMTRPSQTLNRSYGYLTWLNGQSTHMIPGTQIVFNGPIIPAAPTDLYAALGKGDQKIHVVPSQGLVVVRMGDDAGYSQLAPSAFDNEMWVKLNAAMCSTTGISSRPVESAGPWTIYPQPAASMLHISGIASDASSIAVYDLAGRHLVEVAVNNGSAVLNIGGLAPGHYVVSDGWRGQLFLKQ